MKRIILASQSPRRKELLTRMGIADFDVIPSDFYEELDDTRNPEEVAMELGLGKAMVLAQQYPDAVIIGSDTIVTVDGQQLAKAETIEEARAMLRAHAEHPVQVTSSLAVVCVADGLKIVQAENTMVYFKPYDEAAVEAYLAIGDYADKAGGFGIQSGAAPLIDHIAGNADVIVGFPTHLLAPVLQQLGYEVQPVAYELPSSIRILPAVQ